MALPVKSLTSDRVLSTRLADLSTAGSCFVVAPCRGTVVRAYSVIANAITVANATWSLEINDVAVTGSTVTVTQSGSAAGDVDICTPTGANLVKEGDNIEFVNAAGSTDTCITHFYAVVRPF